MVVYVTALGAVGDHFQLTRRIGIVGYFTGTYLCQLLVTYRFWHIGEPNILARTMVGVCTAVLVAGFVTLAWDAISPDYDDVEDAFEWSIALTLQCWFLLSHWALRPPAPIH